MENVGAATWKVSVEGILAVVGLTHSDFTGHKQKSRDRELERGKTGHRRRAKGQMPTSEGLPVQGRVKRTDHIISIYGMPTNELLTCAAAPTQHEHVSAAQQ